MVENFKVGTFHDLVESGIKLDVREDSLYVAPEQQSDGQLGNIQFYGQVENSRSGTVEFFIRTLDSVTGLRHPYFESHRASVLAARAIRHFELQTPIHGIKFWWVSDNNGIPSTNYRTYLETRDRLREQIPID